MQTLKAYKLTTFFLGIFVFSQLVNAQNETEKLNLHVPSPVWEDQIIYFLMTDRFNDGDPTNNDQGYNEYDPGVLEKYSGGDIQGILNQLDYIQNLGATTLWTTPIFANQWWDDKTKYAGYHGYWPENFVEVDKHVGTIVDFQKLSHHLHERGMYLIQDIVINHTGNFYGYDGKYNENDPTENFAFNETSVPVKAPTQYPFSLNNVNDPQHRTAGIYHWTPDITDYGIEHIRVNYELGMLDDINTQNVRVREVFRDSYGYWIRVVGVDGFRIDTVIYVEKEFWNDFMHAPDENAPGIQQVAKATGREHFIAFGEAMANSKPYSNTGDKLVADYMGTEDQPGLNSMLNFPLYYSIKRVFSQGKPTAYLGYRLNEVCNAGIFPNPHRLPNFIDNHDTNRFIQNATVDGFKQALFFQFAIPGIPVIYMGTEQMLHESRASMFAKGWGSEGKDHFDQTSEMYLFIKELTAVRKANQVLTRGDLTMLRDSDLGAGVLAFRRKFNEKDAIIIFNTADEQMLLSNLETGLESGSKLNLILGMNFQHHLKTGQDGLVTTELPPRMAGIFMVESSNEKVPENKLKVTVQPDISGKTFSENMQLKGTVNNKQGNYLLVIDGKLNNALELDIDHEGNWEIMIPNARFPFGKSKHDLTIYSPELKLSTPLISFSTDIEIQGKQILVRDAVNDDHGQNGNYTKPGDMSYGSQMDIREVKTTAFGGNLQLELTMEELSQLWIPPHGFDHVLFHVFIDLPNTSGSHYIPMLNAVAPEGFEWDYAANIGGWQSAYYSSEGATEDHFGTKLSTTPNITVDKEKNKITFQFSPEAFGSPATLEGTKIYITTWDDYGNEGGFRQITEEGELWKFGGSDDSKPVMILDDTEVIEIK
ncbi:MAG: alpha-amylase family glycosyl hydrolase [Bacteroidota bacterium]